MKTLVLDNLQEKISAILDSNGRDPAKLIPILQQVQEEFRYLPQNAVSFIADSLRIPRSRVYGVATFYSHFSLEPKGRNVIKICDGTACHVKRSGGLLEAIQKKLKLSAVKNTTDDMAFSLETVSCLGACGLAPVVLINDEVYGQMTPEKINKVIDIYIEKEKL